MNDQDYIRFGELISRHYILPKDLGISSRKVNYWNKKILPFFQKDKHAKMNIPQAVWLYIVKELSNIGLSSAKLEDLAQKIWHEPRNDKYADSVLEKNINDKNNGLSDEAREILRNQLEDEMLMEELRKEINTFTDMIKSCIKFPEIPHAFFYVPEDKEHFFLYHSPELLLKLQSLFSDKTIISIPILNILTKNIGLDLKSNQKTLKYLTGIENQIRDIVIFKRPKVVEIAFDDNHIKPRKITEKHVRQDEIADFFLRNKLPKGTRLLIDERSQDNYKLTLITK